MHAPILVFSTDANETLHFDEDEILELAKIQVPSADYATEEDHTAYNGVEELFYKKGSYKNCVMHLSADEVKELQAILMVYCLLKLIQQVFTPTVSSSLL